MRRFSNLFAALFLSILVAVFSACGGGGSNSANSTAPASSSSTGSSSATGSASPGTGSSSSGSGSSSSSGSGSTSSVAYVYTAGTGEIRAYAVGSNGSLTSVSGSPFAFSAAANAKIATNGSNLYAVATDNNNLNVFSIARGSGALSMASTTSANTGDPNASDYAIGVALDHSGSSLYVNLGLSDLDSGINLFSVGSGPTAQEIKFLLGGAYVPPPLIFSPNNQYGYASLCTARTVGVFGWKRASDGTLSTISVGPGALKSPMVPGVGFCPGPIAISAKGYMAVVWNPDAMGSSVPSSQPYVMTYTINADGTLSVVSNSQVKTASTSANKLVVSFDPTGALLALAGDAGVETYSLNGNGVLSSAGVAQAGGAKFQDVAWDSTNHVFATTSNQLYVFNSASGVLTQASGSPYAGDPDLAVLPLQ